MARPLRLAYPGAIYHVTARGNARHDIVCDQEDRQRFVRTLAEMVEYYQVICHAWVLMDNHYHLLLETPKANLSRALRHLNGVYTQTFNRRHQRVGHLFQGRFKAILVEKEAYLLGLCRYVVLNPVRAGLVRHPRQWRWSSYRATAGEQAVPSWLTVAWVLGHFGQRRKTAQHAYRHFVAEGKTHLPSPWDQLQHQMYLGGKSFLEKITALLPETEAPEIPLRQRRPVLWSMDEVIARVAQTYEQEVAEIERQSHRPSEARQVAIYAARRLAGADLKAIGHRFGLSYTTVSRRVSAVTRKLEHERRFRRKVEKIFRRTRKG